MVLHDGKRQGGGLAIDDLNIRGRRDPLVPGGKTMTFPDALTQGAVQPIGEDLVTPLSCATPGRGLLGPEEANDTAEAGGAGCEQLGKGLEPPTDPSLSMGMPREVWAVVR